MAKKIHDLESLDKEIGRLRGQAKLLENKMDNSFSYLQEHSSSLMINTLLSGLINKNSVSGGIVNLFVQSERLQKALGNLAEILVDRIANVLDFLVNKITPEKD
ncbi:MAG TPA: hypothetical protein VK787_14360 [Puia sp.]|jgi:hypothetical protein|nr:hypothetical protein [Puia sp.]